MKRISVEIVPHDEVGLKKDLETIDKYKKYIDCVNLPDIARLPMRAWEGAVITQPHIATIPHVRAMDIDLNKPLHMKNYFVDNNINEVLVIAGDPPQDMLKEVFPTETIDVIHKFHEELPDVKVYAGIDQYRSGIQEELYKVRRKLQAGAVGFFTQPFFDMRFMEMYADLLDGLEIYWGVSPVLSARSKAYWVRKDKAVFPKSFETTMQWNVDFAKRVIDFIEKTDGGLYFMPITISIAEFLPEIFGKDN